VPTGGTDSCRRPDGICEGGRASKALAAGFQRHITKPVEPTRINMHYCGTLGRIKSVTCPIPSLRLGPISVAPALR